MSDFIGHQNLDQYTNNENGLRQIEFQDQQEQTLSSACFKLSYKSASSAEVQPTLRFLAKVGYRLADTQFQLSLAKLAEYDGLFEVYYQPT